MSTAKRRIRVLVVDDSIVFRETLARKIASDPFIEVVATASDPYMARDKILEFQPDVMTLDVEMPRMSGIEFLRKLIPQYPIPVVVVSATSENIFDALNAGAVDFVTKPDTKSFNQEVFVRELIIKIKIASTAKVEQPKRELGGDLPVSGGVERGGRERIIAIGASTGGTEAIYEVLRALPREVPGIVIVQHMPPVFTAMYAKRLNGSCCIEVKEAQTGDAVVPGRALLAPGGYHMRLDRKGGKYVVEVFKGDNVNGHCPSVDVLFNSVADKAGSAGLGVILTGMGYDGAKGLLKMKQAGAITFGQDQQSCIVYGMPKVAYEIGAVERQAPLANIPRLICSAINRR
ncbi:MAG: chemotaxis response regulator protein-glutamate methylesterase [Sporomusaceae bacterium]|nr:chemotaxis response regulator protein-glutamate methylesterase [Sporomusaceae bacterium]